MSSPCSLANSRRCSILARRSRSAGQPFRTEKNYTASCPRAGQFLSATSWTPSAPFTAARLSSSICRAALPSDRQQFNVLYLVSSAQPDFAEDLVRAARRARILFVWNQNGVAYPGWAGAESERYNGPMRRLRAMADYIIYQSEFCRTSAEKFLGPCATPHEVLANPIDLVKFAPAPERHSGSLRLLVMGTHGYAQRVLSPIQCVRALRMLAWIAR